MSLQGNVFWLAGVNTSNSARGLHSKMRACSADVASSGALSSLTRTKRGKRMLIPFSASTNPMAALWRGDIEKSAHFTSHTVLLSNQTSGKSVSEYLQISSLLRRSYLPALVVLQGALL